MRAIKNGSIIGTLFFFGLLSTAIFAESGFDPATAFSLAQAQIEQGEFESAVDGLTHAHSAAIEDKHTSADSLIELGVYLSEAHQLLGQSHEGLQVLQTTLQSIDASVTEPSSKQLVMLYSRLGSLLIDVGGYEEARSYLDSASEILTSNSDLEQQVLLLNSYARMDTARGEKDSAYAHLERAREIAEQQDISQLTRSLTLYNYAKITVDTAQLADIDSALRQSSEATKALPDSAFKVQQLLNIAVLYSDAQETYDLSPQLRLQSQQLLQQAYRISKDAGMHSLASYALGHSGLLYESESRHEEALGYAQRAIFHAQQVQDARSLYQWEWLAARIFWAQQQRQASADAYRRSIANIEQIRTQLLMRDPLFFQQTVGPLYYQYADLALRMARDAETDQARSELLFSTRDLLESFKRAEVEDYFRSECVMGLEESTMSLSGDPGTAVIYPVLFEDRMEVLVFTGEKAAQYESAVRRADMTQMARDFRLQLEVDTGSKEYLRLGNQLYQHLIAPYEESLRSENIDTIVMVPDGPLRTIPLAALYDGEHYLIENYAVAASLGLSLTVSSEHSGKPKMFAGGVTESVQGFDALPYAGRELDTLASEFNSRVYVDNAFTVALVNDELSEGKFSVAHFATHGEFASTIEDSFLLTHDGKLNMGQLESSVGAGALNGQALDLLVLSACQTAAGDDRAALGLAGVAVQAGAASALATLWSINDEATYELINAFYSSFQAGIVGKASSLQQAQIKLIENEKYKHPSHWSPFLLVGNWI